MRTEKPSRGSGVGAGDNRVRAAMQAAVRRHEELVRESIAAFAGHIFKTVGDAFCAVFTRPEDAVDRR